MAEDAEEIKKLEEEIADLQRTRRNLMKQKIRMETKRLVPAPVTFKEYEEFKSATRPSLSLESVMHINTLEKTSLYRLCGMRYLEADEKKLIVEMCFAVGPVFHTGYKVEIHNVENTGYHIAASNLPYGLELNLIKKKIPMKTFNDVSDFLQYLHICGRAFFNRKTQLESLREYFNKNEIKIDLFTSFNERFVEIKLLSDIFMNSREEEMVRFIISYDIDSFLPMKVTYEKEHLIGNDKSYLDNCVSVFMSLNLKEAFKCIKHTKAVKQQLLEVGGEEVSGTTSQSDRTQADDINKPASKESRAKNSLKALLQNKSSRSIRFGSSKSDFVQTSVKSKKVNVTPISESTPSPRKKAAILTRTNLQKSSTPLPQTKYQNEVLCNKTSLAKIQECFNLDEVSSITSSGTITENIPQAVHSMYPKAASTPFPKPRNITHNVQMNLEYDNERKSSKTLSHSLRQLSMKKFLKEKESSQEHDKGKTGVILLNSTTQDEVNNKEKKIQKNKVHIPRQMMSFSRIEREGDVDSEEVEDSEDDKGKVEKNRKSKVPIYKDTSAQKYSRFSYKFRGKGSIHNEEDGDSVDDRDKVEKTQKRKAPGRKYWIGSEHDVDCEEIEDFKVDSSKEKERQRRNVPMYENPVRKDLISSDKIKSEDDDHSEKDDDSEDDRGKVEEIRKMKVPFHKDTSVREGFRSPFRVRGNDVESEESEGSDVARGKEKENQKGKVSIRKDAHVPKSWRSFRVTRSKADLDSKQQEDSEDGRCKVEKSRKTKIRFHKDIPLQKNLRSPLKMKSKNGVNNEEDGEYEDDSDEVEEYRKKKVPVRKDLRSRIEDDELCEEDKSEVDRGQKQEREKRNVSLYENSVRKELRSSHRISSEDDIHCVQNEDSEDDRCKVEENQNRKVTRVQKFLKSPNKIRSEDYVDSDDDDEEEEDAESENDRCEVKENQKRKVPVRKGLRSSHRNRNEDVRNVKDKDSKVHKGKIEKNRKNSLRKDLRSSRRVRSEDDVDSEEDEGSEIDVGKEEENLKKIVSIHKDTSVRRSLRSSHRVRSEDEDSEGDVGQVEDKQKRKVSVYKEGNRKGKVLRKDTPVLKGLASSGAYRKRNKRRSVVTGKLLH